MVSYAQDAEDVLLKRVFPQDYQGFYIDAGASDPVRFSVTKHFYDQGWRGVNIEPVPSVWLRLRDQRPRDVNLNAALSDREGRLTFYEVTTETTWFDLVSRAGRGVPGPWAGGPPTRDPSDHTGGRFARSMPTLRSTC